MTSVLVEWIKFCPKFVQNSSTYKRVYTVTKTTTAKSKRVPQQPSTAIANSVSSAARNLPMAYKFAYSSKKFSQNFVFVGNV